MNEANSRSWMWIGLLWYLMHLERCLVQELGFIRSRRTISIYLSGPGDSSIRYFERLCTLEKRRRSRSPQFRFIAFSKGTHLGLFTIVAGPDQFANLCCCLSYWTRSPNQTLWSWLAFAVGQDINFELLVRQLSRCWFSPCSPSGPWLELRLRSRPTIEWPPVLLRILAILCSGRSWRWSCCSY